MDVNENDERLVTIQLTPDQIRSLAKLGGGHFGVVLCLNLPGEQVAVKSLIQRAKPVWTSLFKEFRTWKLLQDQLDSKYGRKHAAARVRTMCSYSRV